MTYSSTGPTQGYITVIQHNAGRRDVAYHTALQQAYEQGTDILLLQEPYCPVNRSLLSNAVGTGRLIEAVRIDDVLRSTFFLDSREISPSFSTSRISHEVALSKPNGPDWPA